MNITAIHATSPRIRRRQIEGYSTAVSNGPLRCLPACECRCHTLAYKQVFPSWVVPYVGKLFMPTRLFHPPWSSWSRCDVQTCRGDLLDDMLVRWLLPARHCNINIKFSSESYPIYLSIGIPRLIARNAPVWRLVESGDLDAVRDLFLDKKASVYDVTENGGSLITVSIIFCLTSSAILTVI